MNALQTMNTYNKIIRYRLDDKQYFTDLLKRENATEQAVAEIIGDKEYFTAIFTLYGYERNGSSPVIRTNLGKTAFVCKNLRRFFLFKIRN